MFIVETNRALIRKNFPFVSKIFKIFKNGLGGVCSLYFCLVEDLGDGWEGVGQERGEVGFCDPCGFGNIFLFLRGELGGGVVAHVVPIGVFEVPDGVADVAVMSDTDEVLEL